MFSWICPQCGADVPPAYNECPNCKPVAAAPPPAPVVAPVVVQPLQAPRVMAAPPRPTAPPMPTAPPVYAAPAPPPQPQAAAPAPAADPQVQYVYVKQPGLPAWLVTVGVFVGLLAAGYAFYTLVLNKHGSASASNEKAADEPAAAKGPRGSRDLSKHLEVAGIRILEENHRPTIRLMLINHSSADIAPAAGSITLITDGKGDPVAVIPFSLASLGAYEAKDISAPLKTKLRAYELPDWQFIKAQVKLSASAAE